MTQSSHKLPLTAALAGVGAGVCIAAYWMLNHWLGPFSAARRYGRQPGVADWSFYIPSTEWLWYAAGLWIVAAAGLLLFAAMRNGSSCQSAPTEDRPALIKPWSVACIFAVFAFALALAIRILLLQGASICDDEMVYRFQAQTLAQGHWTADPPPNAKAFEHIFLGVYRGHWFGQYSFGHPLILAFGELLGIMGGMGPILAGLLVLIIFSLTKKLFDESTALVAAVLAAFSPLIISTGATLLSQNSATLLVLCAIWLMLITAESGRFLHALLAALALGAAFWCRNQEPALLGLGPLMLVGWRMVRGPTRLPLLAGLIGGAILTLGPLLLLQWHLWGHPTWTNYQAYWWGYLHVPIRSPFGFGPAPWDVVHTPLNGLRSMLNNLVRLDAFLIGVPLALVTAVIGFWPEWRKKNIAAVFLGAPLTFITLFFYFWPGLADTGPQLYHAAGALLLPFIAAGLVRLSGVRLRPFLTALIVVVLGAMTFWPTHLGALRRIALAAEEIPRLTHNAGIRNAIVFTDLRPWAGGYDRSWVLGRPLPRPDLSDSVLYLRTQGKPVDEALTAELFSKRTPYFLKQIKGKVALMPLADFTGENSLLAAARTRDLPP